MCGGTGWQERMVGGGGGGGAVGVSLSQPSGSWPNVTVFGVNM